MARHLLRQPVGGFQRLADIGPVGRVRRRRLRRHSFQGLVQPLPLSHHVVLRVDLSRVVQQNVGEVADLLLQAPDIHLHPLDIGEELLAQRRLDVLLGDQLVVFAGVAGAGAGDPVRPGADVAATVDQATAERQPFAGRYRRYQVGIAWVGEQAQRPCGLLAAAGSGGLLDLGVGGVRCAAGREPPLQADAPGAGHAAQVGQRRRRRGLALKSGLHTAGVDRADLHHVQGAYPHQITTGIDARHVETERRGSRHPHPVARVLAPFGLVGHRVRRGIPGGRQAGHRQPLVDLGESLDPHVLRRRLHARRNAGDRRQLDARTVVDGVELARVVLQRGDLEKIVLRPGDAHDAEALGGQAVALQRPLPLGPRRLRIGGGHGQHAAYHRLDAARLGLAVRQVDQQAIAGSGLDVAVEGQRAAIHRAQASADLLAGLDRVGYGDDLPRRQPTAIHAGAEGHRVLLQLLGQQRPLATPLRLALGGAADRGDLQLADAVAALRSIIVHRYRLALVAVARIVVVDQGQGVAIALAAAAVVEVAAVVATHGVRRREGVGLVLRHVGYRHHFRAGPVGHAAEDRCQVAQHCPGFGATLQVQVAAEARLLAALAVGHRLVAVLGDAVQRPLVDHARVDPPTEAEALVQHDVVPVPGRVAGPGRLERAVPGAAVATGLRIVVARHPHPPAARFHRYLRNALELAGIELDEQQRGVRVAQLGVDHLGDRLDPHGVGDAVVVLVRRQAAHAHLPAAPRLRQVDTVGALVAAGGLVVQRSLQRFLPGTAVDGDVDRVVDAVADHVTVFLLALDGRPGQAQAHRRELGVAHRADPGRVTLEFDADRQFVFHGGHTGNVFLVHRARTELPGHSGEVHRAVRRQQRRIVQVDRTAVDATVKLAFAQCQENLRPRDRAHRVRHLHRLARLLAATLVARDGLVHDVPSGKKTPAHGGPVTALPATAGPRHRCRR